jgi:hypothetical protein
MEEPLWLSAKMKEWESKLNQKIPGSAAVVESVEGVYVLTISPGPV